MATASAPYIALYNALRSAGVDEAEAKSAAEAIAVRDDLVSKLEFERGLSGLNDRLADLKIEMAEFKAETSVAMAHMSADGATNFQALYRWLLVGGAAIAGINATATALIRFLIP